MINQTRPKIFFQRFFLLKLLQLFHLRGRKMLSYLNLYGKQLKFAIRSEKFEKNIRYKDHNNNIKGMKYTEFISCLCQILIP